MNLRFASQDRSRRKVRHRLFPGGADSSRGGFVLVMVLILLTVAAISLSGMARRSMKMAADSADAQAEFECKWQTATLQQALLNNVERILESAVVQDSDTEGGSPEASAVEGVVTAGEFQYEFLVADEDAKINLNTVLRRDPDAISTVVRSMNRTTVGKSLMPRPSSLLPKPGRDRTPLRSWGQVFAPRSGGSQGIAGRDVQGATREMTCWGSGRLNVVRASDHAIRTLCGLSLSGNVIDELLEARAAGDVESLDDLIFRLELKAEERFEFQRLLTDRSNCFTLWLTASNRQREWTRLSISHSARGNLSSIQSFTW